VDSRIENDIQIIEKFISAKDLEKAEKQLIESFEYADLSMHNTAALLHLLARTKFSLNKPEEALSASTQEIDILTNLAKKNETLRAAYSTRGFLYHMGKDWNKALDNYHQAYNVASTIEQKFEILDQTIYAIANISNHYLGQYDVAFKFYNLGKENAERFNEIGKSAFYLTHLGMADLARNNLKSALQYCNQALEIINKTATPADSIDRLFTILEIVKIKVTMGRYLDATQDLIPILQQSISNSDPFAFAISRIILAKIFLNEDLSEDLRYQIAIILPDELNANQLIDKTITLLVDTEHTGHLVEVYCEKAKLDVDNSQKWLKNANEIALQDRKVPSITRVKKTCEGLKIDYSNL